jgi:hypothetical protein
MKTKPHILRKPHVLYSAPARSITPAVATVSAHKAIEPTAPRPRGRQKGTPLRGQFSVSALVNKCPGTSFSVTVDLTPIQMAELGLSTVHIAERSVKNALAENALADVQD